MPKKLYFSAKLFQLCKKHYLVIIFLFLYLFLLGFKVVSQVRPFFDWDEAIYAQVGREMIAKLSLVPLWQGQPWLDKPPLVPLLYGIVETISPVVPEISTRLFTLFMSVLVLGLTYILYVRISKNTLISLLTVILTAFIPDFLQRSQVVNIDVFMLLGWLGYVIFFENYWVSLLFLSISFFSKSLLGFYPPAMFLLFYTYRVVVKQMSVAEYKKKAVFIVSQVLLLSIWYVIMYFFYGNAFIQAHFIESHFKRVTASIESHFGKRTFYIDLLIEEFSVFMALVIAGFGLLIKKNWKKFGEATFLLSVFFVPWFIFLNLTKTKIAWYYYPTIPQFAYLAAFSLLFFREKFKKVYLVAIIIFVVLLSIKIEKANIFGSYYSNFEPHYYMALYAKKNCSNTLHVVIDKDTRTAHDTLAKLNLLISTSTWWGNHASIVYYYDGLVDFIYDEKKIPNVLSSLAKGQCVVMNQTDTTVSVEKYKNVSLISTISPYLIYEKTK